LGHCSSTALGLDSLEGELFVVGFDAAYVVRGGGVQRLHQEVQRAAELQYSTRNTGRRGTQDISKSTRKKNKSKTNTK